MKVIHQEDTSSWVHRFKCVHCDTVLEADQDDLQVRRVPDGSDMRLTDVDSKRTEFYLNCPACSGEHVLASKEIPKLLQHRVTAARLHT